MTELGGLSDQLDAMRKLSKPLTASRQCNACQEPAKSKKKYCDTHNKAFDNILRQATKLPLGVKRTEKVKNKTSKKKKGKAGQAQDETDEEDSDQEMQTDEHKAFSAIFGSRTTPGDPMVANQVILDYCAMFPSGEEKTTKCRGKLQLTNYTISAGTRHTKRQKRTRVKMDYEAFVTAMKRDRQWDALKADAKWKALDVPDNFVDNNGPAPFVKRLRIPSNLMCTDQSESDAENYEDRSMKTEGQAVKNASKEVKDGLLGEMSTGFSEQLQRADMSTMFQALPQKALTLSSADQKASGSMSLLSAAFASMAPPGERPKNGKAEVEEQVATIVIASPSKPVPLFDLKSAQTSFVRSGLVTVTGLKNKVVVQVQKCTTAIVSYLSTFPSHDDDEFCECQQRLQVCMLWLNQEPGAITDSTGQDMQGNRSHQNRS